MPPPKTATQIAVLTKPFGGWVSALSGAASATNYAASVEGVEENIVGSVKNGNQIAESNGITLFTPEKFGHMGPGQGIKVATDAGNKVNDLPLNGVQVSGAFNSVAVLGNGRIIQFDPSSIPAMVSQTLYYDPSSHTPSTGQTNGDILLFRDYTANAPVEWVIWSWDYAGSPGHAEISIIHSAHIGNSDSSAVDGWYSGISGSVALTNGVPHKLCKGPDGNIYVLDGAIVRQITLANGLGLSSGNAVIGNALQLGSGWVAQSICAYKNYVAIITSSVNSSNAIRAETKVFLWDGTSSTVNGVTSVAPQFIFDLPDNSGQGILFDGSTLYAFTSGRNFSSKIFIFKGSGFVQVFETPFISPSNSSLQGSLESFQDGIIMAANRGSANFHVCRFYGGGFHDEMRLNDGSNHFATAVGMCRNLFQKYLFFGVKYSTSYYIWVTDPTSTNTQYNNGSAPIDLKTILYTAGVLGRRVYPLGFKMTLNRIKIFLSQWGTGSSLLLSVFNNYDASSPGGATDKLNRTIDTMAYPSGTYEIDITDFAITDLSAFYANIRWTHASGATPAIIREIIFYLDPSN